MRPNLQIILHAFALLIAVAATVTAAVPGTINYQGYLKDSAGVPVTTPTSIRFSLYSSDPARSNPVWSETKSVTPANGIYSTQLGSVTPITAPFDVPYWLGVKVEGDDEMPLQPLSSAPYALRATTADNATSSVTLSGQTLSQLDSRYISPTVPIPSPQQVATLRWDQALGTSTFPSGNYSYALTFDGNSIWVANTTSNTVTRIRPASGAQLGVYPVGNEPVALAFDGSSVWVANQNSNNIMKLDRDTGAVLKTVTVGSRPVGLTFDGSYIWVSNFNSNSVTKVLASDGTVAGTYPAGADQAIAFDGSSIWVGNFTSNNVMKLNPATGEVLGTYPVGSGPIGMAYDGSSIWVSNYYSNNLMKLRPSDGAVLGTYPVGVGPFPMVYDGNSIWVANQGSNTLMKLDPANGALLSTFTTGSSPSALTYDGDSIWVANLGNNSVTRFLHAGARLGTATVASAQLAPSAVTTTAIADSSVTDAKIGGVISAAKLDLSSKVAKAGDTMTGTLNLPANGFTVGSNQLVVSGTNVGIGTSSPAAKLDVVLDSNDARFSGFGANNAGINLINTAGGTQTWSLWALGNSGYWGAAKGFAIGDVTAGKARLVIDTIGNLGYGANSKPGALFTIGGSVTVPNPTSWGAHLLEVSGTTKSSSAGQAYHKGIYVAPTFDVGAGYANYLTGIETYMGGKTGVNVAHSVVGYHLNGQPTSGNSCNVGFGISVPNQNTSLCNGRYGFYQGDTAAQYNYFASNVGIGTPFPTQALDVSGTVKATAFQGNGSGLSNVTAVNVSGTVAIANGGTGATSAPTALTNLGAVAKAGDTMTGTLNLPANGLQMAGNQISTSGGNIGYGVAAKNGTLFTIGGSITVPAPTTWGAHLLELTGTTRSNMYGQAYHKGLYVAPTFDLTDGYANYLTGIETYMGSRSGSWEAHSVVGYHMNGQPSGGLECSVGFGISVPNQQPSLCNGRYGFYQGDSSADYNYFVSKVGIGTPFPSQALDVQGNIQVSGNISAAGTGTMPVYDNAGAARNTPHMVTGTVPVTGSAIVTLSGAAAFSGVTNYICAVTSASSPAPFAIQNTSASSFTITGSGNANYICVGT